MTALRGPLRKRNSRRWERHPEDWYVEPDWCSIKLFEAEEFEGQIWDPSCGLGRIPTAALTVTPYVFGTDIVDRGYGQVWDFMQTPEDAQVDNIVSNPPFGIADAYVPKALRIARRKVALLLPSNWVQGEARSKWMQTTPLRRLYFICPRPSMPPGPVIMAGIAPGNGTTDYAWFVWQRGYVGTPEIGWIRRDRK